MRIRRFDFTMEILQDIFGASGTGAPDPLKAKARQIEIERARECAGV